MRNNYLGGNYGYGHAKQALFELMIDKFKAQRETFNYFMENPDQLNKKLEAGEEKARVIGKAVLARVKEKLGY